MELVDLFIENSITILSQFGIFAGVLLVLLESIIPVLPLSVFIALNMMAYGNVLGLIISFCSTIAGCSISFFLFRSVFSDKLYKFITRNNKEELSKWLKTISKISFPSLALIMAIPFTPAFMVNIASGLSQMKYRKFFFAMLVGKIVLVYFWGYIGTTLLESLTNVKVLIRIGVLLLGTYILSRIIASRLNIK